MRHAAGPEPSRRSKARLVRMAALRHSGFVIRHWAPSHRAFTSRGGLHTLSARPGGRQGTCTWFTRRGYR